MGQKYAQHSIPLFYGKFILTTRICSSNGHFPPSSPQSHDHMIWVLIILGCVQHHMNVIWIRKPILNYESVLCDLKSMFPHTTHLPSRDSTGKVKKSSWRPQSQLSSWLFGFIPYRQFRSQSCYCSERDRLPYALGGKLRWYTLRTNEHRFMDVYESFQRLEYKEVGGGKEEGKKREWNFFVFKP